ncbi:tetratricopeptide repeat protein [Corallococcus praedator]|uniref:Tetratricopeptide repeat protein n=1 Tax=Corallococcus praedator TaxID=2316724 RepID=A0ABX9Q730_9BACT|nr:MULTISPECIES: tetratricopeptide repeat protein [Corallococcus]RKH15830.1 tetratricopeptide repeat protein [Corallococcus sp. CA047B]RKH28551.1 tetratricopeptide repeat protein [Corallococcus sp. CA031C]RKH92379.1 tetratricopeptide repeat protein [Corallococcus praedator]
MDLRIVLGLALMLVSPAWSQPAASAGPEFQARMSAASHAYEELDYEHALEQLDAAKTVARDSRERGQTAIFRGLVLADLGRRQEALASFKNGLSLLPDASLPVKVSPKVSRDFEEVKRTVQEELTRSPRPPSDAPNAMPDAQVALVPPRAQAEVRHTRSMPVLPLALLGGGVVLGGVGGYFGLQSRSNVNAARDDAFYSDRTAHLDSARGQALAANVLLGAAITAAAGAAVVWLLTDDPPTSRTEVSP